MEQEFTLEQSRYVDNIYESIIETAKLMLDKPDGDFTESETALLYPVVFEMADELATKLNLTFGHPIHFPTEIVSDEGIKVSDFMFEE